MVRTEQGAGTATAAGRAEWYGEEPARAFPTTTRTVSVRARDPRPTPGGAS